MQALQISNLRWIQPVYFAGLGKRALQVVFAQRRQRLSPAFKRNRLSGSLLEPIS